MKIFFNFYKQKNNCVNIKNSLIILNLQLYKKINFTEINNLDLFKGLNTFILKGKKLFIYSKLNTYFNFFYSNIYNNNNLNSNSLKFSDFSYFYEIKSSINENFFLNNPLNLLKWYLNYFSFMFNFKIASKQVKKKIKSTKNDLTNNSLKITFILKKKRNIFFFKWLKRLFFLNYSSNFFFTFCSLLNDVFFNFKNSNLYKYKLSIYKNLLSS